MHARVRIDLHLDAFGVAIGGAWTLYDVSGRRLGAEVFPEFVAHALPEAAAAFLVAEAIDHAGRQLTLF
jgi:hypothetical protein